MPRRKKTPCRYVARFKLHAGQRVEIRRRSERDWNEHMMRRAVEMRTTARKHDTLYLEFLNFEVRVRADWLDDPDTRFWRY